MIVYHGGYCEIKSPKILPSRNNKDFGQGFYCTAFQMQAQRWASRFDTPVISQFVYTENKTLNMLKFVDMTEQWLDFIADCRSGKMHNFDIVIGAMANDQVWNYIADFLSGLLTREQFWILAKFKKPTHQIAFCTEAALETMLFTRSYEVNR
jgi:hypothetical protein